MQLVSHEIYTRRSDHRPLVVVPIGDIQWAGNKRAVALDMLKRTIDRALSFDGDRVRFIGMGDYIDFASPSNRQRLRSAALYDTAEDVIDEKAMDLVHGIYDLVLKPTKGKWMGLLEGHHFLQLKHGDTTDMRLCELLDAKFLGTSAFIRLVFAENTKRCPVVLWAHHGYGSSQKAYGPIQKLENQVLPYWEGVDVFLMGHMSKLASDPINRVFAKWDSRSGPELVHRKVLLVGTGGYSKAYVEHAMQGQVPRGGYAEQKMLAPAVLGSPMVRIQPNWRHEQRAVTWAPEITVEI